MEISKSISSPRPLRMKQAKDVAEMMADIYKVSPLTYPKTFNVIMVVSSNER